MELREKIIQWDSDLKPYTGTKFISTHRGWNYFAAFFQLESIAQIETKPGISPTADQTKILINLIKEEKINLLLTDPWFEKETPELIANETGIKILPMALHPDARKNTFDYISMMDYNVELIKNTLIYY